MAITINGTTGIAGVDGSASTPSYQGADTNTGIFYPAADTIAFAEGGAEAMRIDSNGRLGINTTSPAGRLSVNLSGTAFSPSQTTGIGGGVSTRVQFSGTEAGLMLTSDMDSSGNPTGSSTVAMGMQVGIYAVSDIRNQVWWSGGYPLTFTYSSTPGGSPTERMRIASNGYVYINTTDTAAQDGHISIKATVAGQQCIDSWNSATVGTRFHAKFRDSAGATVRGSITSDGANTAYVTSSDYRLKENIAPLTGALSTIVQLKPSVWTWKENQEAGQGFIAHELAEVVPQAVTGEKDAVDADGKPQYQGVDTSFLVATLTAAIQELKAELDTTKSRLAALEAK